MKEGKRAAGFVTATRTLLAAMLIALPAAHGASADGSPIKPRVMWTGTPVVMNEHARQNLRREKTIWEENTYLIGNGRLGATVFCGPRMELPQLDEDSLWVCNDDNTGGFQPFGDVHLEIPHAEFSHYRREPCRLHSAIPLTVTSKRREIEAERSAYGVLRFQTESGAS